MPKIKTATAPDKKRLRMTKVCIKVCIDPTCEEILHNCPKSFTRCKNCGGILVEINQKTYEKKFRLNFFQYDFMTGDFVHEPIEGFQPNLFGD